MNGIVIKSIDISHSAFLNGLVPDVFVEQLSSKLASSVEKTVSAHGHTHFSHYVCSSTLDISCSAGWFEPAALCRRIYEMTGIRCTYSNAMQCATWGFLVRQHLSTKPDIRNIIFSIVDANPLNMSFWEDNLSWGKTNQRITLVHLEIPIVPSASDQLSAQLDDAVVIGKCNPSAMLYDYAREIQKVTTRYENHTLAIPYFEEKMRKGLKRSIGDYPYLPDLYEKYGHLCGADPWMSIAKDIGRMSVEGKQYLVSSIASEGYFCFLSANANAQSRMSIEG
jgi:hypothetical protein